MRIYFTAMICLCQELDKWPMQSYHQQLRIKVTVLLWHNQQLDSSLISMLYRVTCTKTKCFNVKSWFCGGLFPGMSTGGLDISQIWWTLWCARYMLHVYDIASMSLWKIKKRYLSMSTTLVVMSCLILEILWLWRGQVIWNTISFYLHKGSGHTQSISYNPLASMLYE